MTDQPTYRPTDGRTNRGIELCSTLLKNAVYPIYSIHLRCYFIYRLVEGITTAEEVAKNIKPKLITCAVMSVLYDLPRMYLNVNLFGSICSFYHNVIKHGLNFITIRYKKCKFQVLACQLVGWLVGPSVGCQPIDGWSEFFFSDDTPSLNRNGK